MYFSVLDVSAKFMFYYLNIHEVGKNNLVRCLLSIESIVYTCKHVVHTGQEDLLFMNRIYVILSYLSKFCISLETTGSYREI